MTDPLDRRGFLGTAGAAFAGAMLPAAPAVRRAPLASWPLIRTAGPTVAVASTNGLRGVALAAQLMEKGVDTLDAAVEGVKIQELDPTDDSVGYGGLPNSDGVVQLDASCMHGPTKRAGAVAAIEGIKTPSEVAKLVLKYTTHILLVGEGAKRFALDYGFKEEDLLTPASREKWLHWRANRGHEDDFVDVPNDVPILPRVTGTINLNARNAKGEISSVTTTSGLAWKIPGRAGDSPIVGAGQYTDNEIGAAGSTGLGELNIMVCGGFLTVEHMRRGMSPTDATLETLKRVVAMAPPKYIDAKGRPTFNLNMYALDKSGRFGGGSIYPSNYAAFDGKEAKVRDSAYLFERNS
jgi:N4-(beta-N-acetylglucosaminyl)-L-asparaginase